MRAPKPPAPPARLQALNTYMQHLETADGAGALPTVGDLLGQRVDRVRLWTDDKSGRVKVKEVALRKDASRHRGGIPGWADPAPFDVSADLMNLLDEISDPEISVDLTYDVDSGAVSLGVEMETPLVGQDLAALAEVDATDPAPSFDDVPFDDSYWTAQAAAEALGVNKSTLTRRIQANKVIGFRLFKNALYVPKDQFDGPVMIPVIAEVLAMFDSDHYAAWQFLTRAVFYGDAHPRPLDRLRAATPPELPGCLDEIKRAKAGHDYGDHG